MSNTEESQALLNGKIFLQNRRPLLLGISPGNPHYYQMEALERLFDFARRNSDKVGKRHQPPLTFTAKCITIEFKNRGEKFCWISTRLITLKSKTSYILEP